MQPWAFSRVFRILVILLVASGAVLAGAPARAASSASYVALGDSYSSGVGAGGYDAASGACQRSSRSYPALWAAANAPATFTFVACSGATAANVVAGQLGGLSSRTTLVTITVGGNDIGFVPIVATCLVGSTSVCASAVSAGQSLARNVLPTSLTVTYRTIRLLAPNARLVVLGYPRLFETDSSCGSLGMSQANRVAVNNGADVLNSVIQTQARAAGATYVDVRPAFTGHGVCAASPWINAPTVPVSDSYHPNTSGYSAGYLPALRSVTG